MMEPKTMILGKIVCVIVLFISTIDTVKYIAAYMNFKRNGISVKGKIIGRDLKKGHSRFFTPKVEYILDGAIIQSLALMPLLNVYWLPNGREITLFIFPDEPNLCVIRSKKHLIVSCSLLTMVYLLSIFTIWM